MFFIAAREHINTVMAELRRVERPFKRIMIAGGGHIGARLATAIEPFLASGEGEFWPQEGWQLLHSDQENAQLVAKTGDDWPLLLGQLGQRGAGGSQDSGHGVERFFRRMFGGIGSEG